MINSKIDLEFYLELFKHDKTSYNPYLHHYTLFRINLDNKSYDFYIFYHILIHGKSSYSNTKYQQYMHTTLNLCCSILNHFHLN